MGTNPTANQEMRTLWNSAPGDTWVALDAQLDGMMRPWAVVLAETVGLAPGERVLDVGCGCGATTLDAATAVGPEGRAMGVDLSEQMLALAREHAEDRGLAASTRFEAADAQVDDLQGPYDAAISRFGVMFFDDPIAAFANIGQALCPGGRLAMVTWAPYALQEWLTVPMTAALAAVQVPAEDDATAARLMFSLAHPDQVRKVLEQAGWSDVAIQDHERRVLVAGGGDLDQAAAFVCQTGPVKALLAEVDPAFAAPARAAIREAFVPFATPQGVEVRAVAQVVTARYG